MAVRKQIPMNDASTLVGARSGTMPSLVRRVNEEGHTDGAVMKADVPAEEDVDIDLREVYFLIMHFLSGGPCHRTCGQLWNELLEHKLLPRRYHAWYSRTGKKSGDEDDDGLSFPLSYAQLVERYPHIEKNHLVKLLQQLLLKSSSGPSGLSDAKNVTGADVPTLLGSGSFSLLEFERAKGSNPTHKGDNYHRWPHSQANQVHALSLREIGGGFAKHHRAPSVRAACYAIAKPSTLLEKIQIIKKLRGHQNAVYCAIFDRSGQHVITGSDDRLVKVWSMETGFCLASCRGHEGDITDLAVSLDNVLVASASNDSMIRVWRLPDGLPISVFRHTGVVTAIAFSPRPGCSHHLLSSCDDGICRLWDARDSNVKPRVYVPKPIENTSGVKTNGLKGNDPSQFASQREKRILCCAFNASGTFFVTGSSDTMARVWSACKWSEEGGNQVNHELDILTGHEHDVNYVQFSGTAVPARSFSADSAKEEKLSKFKNTWFTHDNIVTCSPDGSAIIWVPRSRRNHSRVGRWIRAYHLRVPPPPMPPQQPRGGPRQRNVPTPRGVNMIVWSLDNRFVLAAIMDCRICVWNAVDGSLVHSLTGHTELTYVLDVHPFNPRIAMSAGYDGKTIIWDIWEGVPIRIYETGQFRLVDGKFSPDGTSIVLSDEVGQIYILGTGQGESQKDAKYDQFFLGDYRPLIQDVHGNVLDQETQLPPYRRNMQDLLCDSSIMPYPEPYQSMFQQRRLGALGIDWQPPSVRLAIGTNDDGFFAIPDDLLGQLPPAPIPGNRDRWLEQPAELEDAMDWEQENDAQSDDTGSEYNVTDECTSEGEQGSLNASSSEESECSVDEYENAKHEGVSRAHLRRSKRKKRRSEPISTSCGRFVKKKNVETGDGSRSRIKKYKYSRNGTSALKERSSEKTSRPQRRAAQNALTLFSRIGDGFTEEEDFNEGDSGSQGSGYSQPEESPLSSESERSIRTGKQKCYALEDRSQDDLMPATKPFQHVGTNEEEEANRHEDSNKHAILRKKIVLKLPSRDSRRLILPESTRSDSDIQGNADSPSVQIPLKEEKQLRGCVTSLDVTEAKLAHEPYFESSNTASSPQSAWRVDHGNGINKGLGRSETAPEQPCDLSLGYEGKEIRWGEVKTRTSKRLRVGDFNTADLCKSKVVNSIAVDAQQHLEIMQSSCNPEDGIKEQSIGNGFFLQGQVEHQSELMHMKPQKFFIGSSSGALHVAECGDITPERRTNSLAGHKEDFPENQPMMNANMCPTGNGSAMEADWRTDERYMPDKFERSILKDLSNDNLNEYPEMAETVADNGENVNLNNGGKSSYEAAEIKHSDFAKLRSRCRKTKKGFHDLSVEQKHNPSEEWEDFGNKQTNESIRPIEDMSERLMWRGSGARSRGHWGQQFEGKNEAHNFEYDNDEHIEDIGLNAAVDGDMQNAGEERKWASGVNVHAELENSMGMVQNTSNEDKNHVRLFDGGRKTRSKRIKQAKETFQETESSSKHYMIDNGYNCEGKRTRIQMEGIDARESFVGAEWTSTSRVLSAVRPARNKKSTILANTRMPVEKKKGRQLTRKQCWLMLSEAEEGNRYIPQFRDEVAYLRQGHEEFLEMRRSYEKGPWQEKGPWKTIKGNIQAVEFCQVVELEYNPVAGSGDTCCKLTLKFSDPVSNVFGKNFKLTLPELTNFPDFLVEKSRYDAAISRNWTHRDKCEVWWRAENGEGGSWYSGRVIGVKPKSSEFPDSPWDRYYVQYKNDSSGPHPHSPWELFDLGHHSLDLPRIDSEINIQLQYSISELEEISNENEDYYGLGKLSQVSEKSEFHNRIPLPLSLDIIKRRLDNYYYRSVEAFQHDLRILVANAKFYFCKDPRMLSKLQRLSERISQGF